MHAISTIGHATQLQHFVVVASQLFWNLEGGNAYHIDQSIHGCSEHPTQVCVLPLLQLLHGQLAQLVQRNVVDVYFHPMFRSQHCPVFPEVFLQPPEAFECLYASLVNAPFSLAL